MLKFENSFQWRSGAKIVKIWSIEKRRLRSMESAKKNRE